MPQKKTAAPAIPDEAKKPEDHKPPASEAPEILEATVRGVRIVVPIEVLDDFELLDDLSELTRRRDARTLPPLLRRLVPDDTTRGQLLDLARDKETGRVTIEMGADLVGEIFEGINPNS